MHGQSEVRICGHCGNSAPMDIVARWKKDLTDHDETNGPLYPQAEHWYETLICMTCDKPTFRSVFRHDELDSDRGVVVVLYPQTEIMSSGLPDTIFKAYEAARKVKYIDANAFAVLIGRLLELVCVDQKAEGKNLFHKLNDLSDKGIIPEKLSKVAQGLREHRNIGAHAELGELTEEDVPLLEKLTHAILEYVYTAPALAKRAEKQLAKLKGQ